MPERTSRYADCTECDAKWFAPCEPCAMDARKKRLFEAYGIPTEHMEDR